jgi:hypothetical protein
VLAWLRSWESTCVFGDSLCYSRRHSLEQRRFLADIER